MFTGDNNHGRKRYISYYKRERDGRRGREGASRFWFIVLRGAVSNERRKVLCRKMG